MLIINNASKSDVAGKVPVITMLGTSAECMLAIRKTGLKEVFCVIDKLGEDLVYEVYLGSNSTVQLPIVSRAKDIVSGALEHKAQQLDKHEIEEVELVEEPKEKLPPKWSRATPESIIKGKLCRCKAGSNSGQIGEIVYVKRQGKADSQTACISDGRATVSLSPGSQAQAISSGAQSIVNEMQLRPMFGVPDKVRIEFLEPKEVQAKHENLAVTAPLVSVTVTKREFCDNWLIDSNN